jgi:hypothetical protein
MRRPLETLTSNVKPKTTHELIILSLATLSLLFPGLCKVTYSEDESSEHNFHPKFYFPFVVNDIDVNIGHQKASTGTCSDTLNMPG